MWLTGSLLLGTPTIPGPTRKSSTLCLQSGYHSLTLVFIIRRLSHSRQVRAACWNTSFKAVLTFHSFQSNGYHLEQLWHLATETRVQVNSSGPPSNLLLQDTDETYQHARKAAARFLIRSPKHSIFNSPVMWALMPCNWLPHENQFSVHLQQHTFKPSDTFKWMTPRCCDL